MNICCNDPQPKQTHEMEHAERRMNGKHNEITNQKRNAVGSGFLFSKKQDHSQHLFFRKESTKSIAQDLNKLSRIERERLYEEIHGVADVIVETPDFVATSIRQMKLCLSTFSKSSRMWLDRVVFLRPSLEQDDSFYLMFLRARKFEPHSAAKCMCGYFKHKVAVFGESLLGEKITLQHLSPVEMQLIERGSLQVLKNRESSGRAILVSTTSLWDVADAMALTRYLWYTIMTPIEESIDAQQKGYVVTGTCHGCGDHGFAKGASIMEYLWKMEDLFSHLPIRCNSFHVCYDNFAIDLFLKSFISLLPRSDRIRHRLHFGSVLETKHSLLSFGIDASDFFEEGNGILSLEYTQAFMNERQQYEYALMEQREKEADTSFTFYPSKYDVLMGKSPFVREWPGNVTLNRVLDQMTPRYRATTAADRFEKTAIILEVIHVLRYKYGTRFIERHPNRNGWLEVEEKIVRARISQSLRIASQRKNNM